MPAACVALGCDGRGEAVLKTFPRKDRRRRQIWVDRVNRPGWTPTKYSALCEHHFDRDQWELPQEDGKRRLKGSALPTVFVVPPPLDDGGVTRDHPYCLPLYRKIYKDGELKADTPEQGGETMPIEHIKVEAGENENFTPETVEEEDKDKDKVGGREGLEELSSVEEDVESIQCTPDISVFPEQGEPFPIEVVDCENDDVNTFMAEPDKDPLAISAEDQVQAAAMKPYFGNSQKFLFIPKETKMLVNICSKATGEPEVNRSESTNPPSVKPTLKVKSLDGLLDPNVVMKSSASNNASVNSKTILKSPSAVYVKEKLTLSDQPVASSVQKLESPPPSQKLEFDQRVVTLTSTKFNFPPKLKVTSTTDVAPPKLNLVSTKLAIQKDQDFVRRTTNLKVQKPVVLQPRQNDSIHKPRPNVLVHKPSNPNVRLILPGLIKSDTRQTLAKNIKIAFKADYYQNMNEHNEQSRETNKSQSSIENRIGFKKVLLDPQHSGKQMSKQVTIDGTVEEGYGSDKQIGNNNVKAWLDSNIPPDKKNSASRIRTILPKSPVQNNETSNTKKSSVIVLKPFGSCRSLSSNTGGISSRNLSNIKMSQVQNRSITMYKCDQCQNSFISPFALQVHKQNTGHVRKESQGKHVGDEGRQMHFSDKEDFVTVETSESSNDSSDSESEDDDSSVVLLSENDSETDDTTEEISAGPFNGNYSNESDSETRSAEEGEKEFETRSAEEGEKEFEVAKKSVTKTKVLNKFPRQLESSLVKIPNLGALMNLKSSEFLRLSNIINPHRRESLLESGKQSEKEPMKLFDGKRKSEALSFRSEQKLDENRVKNFGHTEENQPTPKVKLTRENLLKNENKISQKPINYISKMNHSETIKNGFKGFKAFKGFKGFKDSSIEKELIVLSSSSSSSSSNSVSGSSRGCSSSDSDDCGDDETSSEDDVSSSSQRYIDVSSSSELNADRISELIRKKKEVELKDEVIKLDETSSEDDVSSNSQRYIDVSSSSELNTDRISKLIRKKKEVVELKDEVLKLKDDRISELIRKKKEVVELKDDVLKLKDDRINELIRKKKEVELKGEVSKLKDDNRKPIVLLPRIDHMNINNLKKANNCKLDLLESTSKIVISDDEEINCRQKTVLGDSNEDSDTILNSNVNSDKMQEKIPVVANVSKEDIIVDLTLTDENERKKIAQKEKPIILLSQLNLDEIEGNGNHETVNIEMKNFSKSKEDELITGVNCKSSSIERVLSVNKAYSKELSCVKRKIKETSSSNTPMKVKIVEGKTKNTVVRSNIKHSCYEKYKMAQIISHTNLNRITQRSLKNVEGNKESSKFNLFLKTNRTRNMLKKVKPNEEKGRNKNNYEKSPKFQTRKCKLCSETVPKSQFKHHVYQHMEMTSVCKVCNKTFSHSVLLRRHMKHEHFL